MTIPKGQHPVCPDCGEEWEFPVEDYTIEKYIGPASVDGEELCPGCDQAFTIEKISETMFDMEPVDD